ncbi:MAG TPA: class II glutamine amidotransferase [Kineosporiaceae bacterium]|nr:class II glutamine amidotransferase [Kineosporiaceae bacterium]
MCRLFALSAAPRRVSATFWLLEAPDSLAVQSRREPDGVGLGVFDEHGRPVVHKRPVAAYEDREFAREARELRSATFIGHIRYASTGGLLPQNTHPFEQDGRLFGHNGVLEDLPHLEQELGDAMSLVRGETDSERFFALVTKHVRGGADVGSALVGAARWVAGNLPLYALNVVLTTPTDLWALRYPDTHELWVLEREAGGPHGRHLEQASAAGTMRVRSGELAQAPAVVVASERVDENPGWRLLRSGELLHVTGDLSVQSDLVLDERPAHLLTLADLSPHAAASQHPTGSARAA